MTFVVGAPLCGQRPKDPLNEKQTEDLREKADQPVEKLKLYVGYIQERVNEMHRLNTERTAQNQNKGALLHNVFDEFTRLCDELQDNMDSYDSQHEDLRKVLKTIVEQSENWSNVLNESSSDAQVDFAHKTAVDANQSLHDTAKQMLDEENKRFVEEKKEKKSKQ